MNMSVSGSQPGGGRFASIPKVSNGRNGHRVGITDDKYARVLMEHVSDVLVVMNDEGFLHYTSPSVERMLGFTPEELIGQNCFDLVHPGDLLTARAAFNDAVQKPGLAGPPVEIRTRHKDGYWCETEAIGKCLPDDIGQLVLVISLRDVTARKKTEEALRQSELKLRLHSQQTRMALIEWNTDFKITGWNSAAEKMFGYTAEEVVGKTGEFILSEKTKVLVEQIGRDLLAGKAGESIVNDNITREGRTIICNWCNTPIKATSGEVIGIVSLVEDVTERMRMAEKIQEQANLLNLAQDAIVVWDLENRITYVNKSAESLYGWAAQEVMEKHVGEFLSLDDTRFEAARGTLMQQGGWSGELRQTTRSGRNVVVSSRWTLVRDQEGAPKSVLVINTDITEKKQLQARFLRTQRVESIGVLTSGIAHDLNNILSPILMIVSMLRKELTSPTAQARLDLLESNAMHGVDIVRQILTFARGLKAEKEPIQSTALLREFSRLIQEIFPKTITFDFQIPDGLWTLQGNATELHQVLLNLCINARDAMPQGGVLTVAAENVMLDEAAAASIANAKPGRHVVWRISDTGTGIAPENINRIFDPFFSTKGEEKGTGLGLSIMLGIVSNHDGCVHVQSELMQGTDFRIYLPAMN